MNIISLLHNESNGDKEMGMQSELEHELDIVQITSKYLIQRNSNDFLTIYFLGCYY